MILSYKSLLINNLKQIKSDSADSSDLWETGGAACSSHMSHNMRPMQLDVFEDPILNAILDDVKSCLRRSHAAHRLLAALLSIAELDETKTLWCAQPKDPKEFAGKLYPEAAPDRAANNLSALWTDFQEQLRERKYHGQFGTINFGPHYGLTIKLNTPVGDRRHQRPCPLECRDDDACLRSVTEQVPEPSDLLYILASARDLDSACKYIVREVDGYPFSLYKTFGDRDLLLRTRVPHRDELRARLDESRLFSPLEVVEVNTELTPKGDAAQKSGLRRLILTPTGYQKAGCQRAFIRLSATRQISIPHIREMMNEIDKAKLAEVVQSIAVGQRAAIIETFTHCSETLLLNDLSLEIDKALLRQDVLADQRTARVEPKIAIEKKTYICYAYYEGNLGNPY